MEKKRFKKLKDLPDCLYEPLESVSTNIAKTIYKLFGHYQDEFFLTALSIAHMKLIHAIGDEKEEGWSEKAMAVSALSMLKTAEINYPDE